MSEAVVLPYESFEEDGPVVGLNHSVLFRLLVNSTGYWWVPYAQYNWLFVRIPRLT